MSMLMWELGRHAMRHILYCVVFQDTSLNQTWLFTSQYTSFHMIWTGNMRQEET